MSSDAKPELVERLVELFGQSTANHNLNVYEHVKNALTQLASECRYLDRFPSIRKLGEILQIAPASVQRAVSELIAENVLISRNGVGLFVNAPPPRHPEEEPRHYTQRGQYVVDLFHWEGNEQRRDMMLRLVERFRAEYPGRHALQLHFDQADRHPDITINVPGPERRLPLRRLAAHDVARGALQVADDDSVPLAHHAMYLFCHADFLDELGLPPPAFSSYREQVDYVARVTERCREKGLAQPVSINRPVTFLGSRTAELLARLRDPADDLEDFRGHFRRVLDYCGLFHHNRDPLEPNGIDRFNRREFPILASYTCALTDVPSDRLLVLPELAIDDQAILSALYAVVSLDTRNPVECIQFLRFLQTPAAQQEFHAQGFVTLEREGEYFRSPAQRHAVRQTRITRFTDPDEWYVVDHVLDRGFLTLVADPSRFDREWTDMMEYSRNYLRFAAERMVEKS